MYPPGPGLYPLFYNGDGAGRNDELKTRNLELDTTSFYPIHPNNLPAVLYHEKLFDKSNLISERI